MQQIREPCFPLPWLWPRLKDAVALQQNLAVMAEDMVCARLAAQLGAQGGLEPALAQAATAKAVSSAAAVRIANVAHAIHGAIGISEEYDLQLLSR